MAFPSELSAIDQVLDFDIDRYISPWVPHNRLSNLPTPISRWFGYRKEPSKEPYAVVQWPITFLATTAGLCLVGGINNYGPAIVDLNPPVIIASLGASAVLDFNIIKSPLAQPRNSVIGNTLAAICGVVVSKGFQRCAEFSGIEWVSGAIGCALASWVMSLTNTIHPPGGATAVLASTQTAVIAMGWWYVPVVLLDSVLLVLVALFFNNILRQYPVYWWAPGTTGSTLRRQMREAKESQKAGGKQLEEGKGSVEMSRPSTANASSSSDRTLRRELTGPLSQAEFVEGIEGIHIRPGDIQLPYHVQLSDDELLLLKNIQERLRMRGEVESQTIS